MALNFPSFAQFLSFELPRSDRLIFSLCENLSSTQLDNMDNLVSIKTLPSRYGLTSRQAVYDRLKDLKISPTRRGKITQEDLRLLDELDKHINSGGTIENFVKSPEVMPVDKLGNWEESQQLEQVPTVDMLLALIEKLVLHQLPKRSPLAQFEELEKAIAHNWVLPTSLVREITGFTPRGEIYQRGSFVFRRVQKVGRDAGWVVEKIN